MVNAIEGIIESIRGGAGVSVIDEKDEAAAVLVKEASRSDGPATGEEGIL